jgi:hypothetical protein
MPPYNLMEDFWEIKTCQPGLDLEVHDLVSFGNAAITVQRANVPSFTWASCAYGSDYFHAQATTTIGTLTYDIVLDPQGIYVTCTSADPMFILKHSDNADTGGFPRQVLSAAGGILVGTLAGALAGALAGLPPLSALLVATVTAGVVSIGHRRYRLKDQEGNAGDDGSSWTAQGGANGSPPHPRHGYPDPTLA